MVIQEKIAPTVKLLLTDRLVYHLLIASLSVTFFWNLGKFCFRENNPIIPKFWDLYTLKSLLDKYND